MSEFVRCGEHLVTDDTERRHVPPNKHGITDMVRCPQCDRWVRVRVRGDAEVTKQHTIPRAPDDD